jgi:hypothetical protein
MTAKTANQRKADERARKRKAGLKKIEYWLHPNEKLAVDRFIAQRKLNAHYKNIMDSAPFTDS